MPLSAAERARRHREKIKQNPVLYSEYLRKEHERYERRKAEGSIKLIHEMTNREKRYARKSWRQRKQRQKERQTSMNNLLNDTPPSTPSTSADFEYRRESRKTSGRKRIRRENASCYRQVEKLKVKLQVKMREADRYRKRLQRYENRTKNFDSPRTKTQNLLKGQRVCNAAKKSLLFHNVLVQGLKEKYKQARANAEKQLLDKVFIRSHLKRYRLKSMAAKELGISLKRLNNKTCDNRPRLQRREKVVERMKNSIERFLCRDDNTRVKAGKKSTKTCKKDKRQIRLLSDSLKTLHLKYTLETSSKMSYSLFCRLKPFYIRHPKPSDRETCQCKRHENLRFKADKLKQLSVIATADLHENAKLKVCDENMKNCMYRDCNTCKGRMVPVRVFDGGQMTQWYEWKTKRVVRCSESETTKTVTMTVKKKESGTIENLVEEFQAELEKCCKHFFNIKNQFESLKCLKGKITEKDLICHIDFSENFSCKYQEEIQSIHFGASQRQVSQHTGVIYTKGATESFCSFSDNLKHGPVGIWAHLSACAEMVEREVYKCRKPGFCE